MLSCDPLSSSGHDGGHIGAVWGRAQAIAPNISEIISGVESQELLENTGAENGVTEPWGILTSDGLFVQLEAVNLAQFNGQYVTPYSGDYFFLLTGSMTITTGWGIVSVYQRVFFSILVMIK